jgi:putative dehydrogenase
MDVTEPAIGFIGLGRLGSVLASTLLEAGHPVFCCSRGRSSELVSAGATIPGDGSPRAVAEAAEVIFTCLPGDGLGAAFDGPDGLLAAARPNLVVELSTAPILDKERLRERLAARGGELLDAPVSGTPAMARAKIAVIYASGDRDAYERVAATLAELSPAAAYVGELGTGTRVKYVANLLVQVHVAATAEAMAFAAALGLDLAEVAELLARSPAASSGQFAVRAPMIAAGELDGKLVTAADARENLDQITAAAAEVGADVPLAAVARDLIERLCEVGDAGSDPAKVVALLGATGSIA